MSLSNYKIKDINYNSSYDLSLMNDYIVYTLNTTLPYQYKYNDDTYTIDVAKIHSFVEFILFKNITHLYHFLYSLNNNRIYEFLNFYKFKKNNTYTKNIYINLLSNKLYKKISVIEFINFFNKSFYIYCDDYIKTYYKTCT
tara:strand:+ start:545 stop:967 length:423 start_codon:yes stop_codon:yes gene_type:complete